MLRLLHCMLLLPDYVRPLLAGIFSLKRRFRPEQHGSSRHRVTAWARRSITFLHAFLTAIYATLPTDSFVTEF